MECTGNSGCFPREKRVAIHNTINTQQIQKQEPRVVKEKEESKQEFEENKIDIDNWLLTPSQPRRSYQGDTRKQTKRTERQTEILKQEEQKEGQKTG